MASGVGFGPDKEPAGPPRPGPSPGSPDPAWSISQGPGSGLALPDVKQLGEGVLEASQARFGAGGKLSRIKIWRETHQ